MKRIKLPIMIALISFFLNFAWEFLQSPLYECFERSLRDNYNHYLLAIGGDSLYTVLIYFIIAIIKRDLLWITYMSKSDVILTIIIGLFLAISIEYRGVYLLGKWNYSEPMPKLMGIGIIPLLQMMILPLLSFKTAIILIHGNKLLKKT